jgi:AcrR family transcriptional regulator
LTSTATEKATTRKRRRRGELRADLIEAARDVFVERGYHGASLRQIAIRANATQADLYRHFPSKAKLFEESVFRPFAEFLEQLISGWRAGSLDELSNADLIGGFTRDMYEFTRTHRGLMLALISADAHGDEELGDVRSAFRDAVAQVIAQTRADEASRGWSDIDQEVTVPITLAMMISTALLDGWFFPPGADHPGKQRVLDELTRYEVRAITGEQIARKESS